MTTASGTTKGSATNFSTLEPLPGSFSPQIARVGSSIKIVAANVPADVKVFFGGIPAVILDVELESNIIVRVPQPTSDIVVPLTVEMLGVTYDIGTFEFIIGTWEESEMEFPHDRVLYEPATASTENKFLIGLGVDNTLHSNYLVWEFDFDSQTWSNVPYSGYESRDPFTVGGFFGSGNQPTIFVFSEPQFYEYTDDGLNLISSLPYTIYKGIAAEINDQIYIYGGSPLQGGTYTGEPTFIQNDEVWRYDGTAWEQIGIQQFRQFINYNITSDLPHFTINDETFFIADGAVYRFDVNTLEFEVYDTNVPVFNCFGGAFAVLNYKFYMGNCEGIGREFWEFDPSTKVWKPKNPLSGANIAYNAATFVHDDVIYLLGNPPLTLPHRTGAQMVLLTFRPDAILNSSNMLFSSLIKYFH